MRDEFGRGSSPGATLLNRERVELIKPALLLPLSNLPAAAAVRFRSSAPSPPPLKSFIPSSLYISSPKKAGIQTRKAQNIFFKLFFFFCSLPPTPLKGKKRQLLLSLTRSLARLEGGRKIQLLHFTSLALARSLAFSLRREDSESTSSLRLHSPLRALTQRKKEIILLARSPHSRLRVRSARSFSFFSFCRSLPGTAFLFSFCFFVLADAVFAAPVAVVAFVFVAFAAAFL